ncbi:MAG: hypothetical protein F6J90_08150 [Moorea sp. SIOASIH]|uniref:hypothetical protein n=1 Tax=Moorena sp. SIOASIH TaxID=2607817 RepID=UPI0013B6C9E5|nr:hypothetical protein [Moorena sp. SIOASIH]NEO36293.1 hypothetical protein [Moorena sp. SIOASIH]
MQKAAAQLRWTGSWYTVFIVVDRYSGRPIDAQFREELLAFMAPYRLMGHDIEIQAPYFVNLDIALTVHVLPNYFQSSVKRSLMETFSNKDLAVGQRGFFHPQAYIVRIDDNGNTNITFGDGQSGARLPTGDENITATYRSGIGLDGEVGAGSLTVLQTRPLGIVEVTNPLPAIGAASPETRDQARSQAPVNILPMERIVSVQDFETFTRTFAGIGKATVATLEIGQNLPLIHLTIADRNGNQVSPDSILYTNLFNAINAARDPAQQRRLAVASKVEIDSYEALYFNLQAGIWVDYRYRSDLVLSEVKTLLVSAFAFEQRTFGQGVTAAEVTALIQGVDGVQAVNLEALYLTGTTQELKSSLEARLAIWNSETKQALPAQLLLLNSQDGVNLHQVIS